MAGAAGRTGPLAAPAEGREIEGRTPPDFSGVGKEGERMRQLIERLKWLLRDRKRRKRWEKYFRSGGMIR